MDEKRSLWLGYGIGLLALFIATLLKQWAEPIGGEDNPFFLFFTPVIILSAWFGGLWTGVATTLVAALLVDYFFLPPYRSFRIMDGMTLNLLAIFVFKGFLISWLIGVMRSARQRAERTKKEVAQLNQELERRVMERTATVDAANRALENEVAERARAGEALRVSEAKLRSVVESTPDSILIIDRDGRILFVNRRTEEMFGYSRKEMIGKPVDILVPERLRERHIKGRESYYSNPRALRLGERGVALFGLRKDGSEFPVDIALSPIETGEGAHVTSLIRDITERKQAEEEIQRLNQSLERRVSERTAQLDTANRALAAEKERLAVTFRSIGDGVITTDTDGKIVLMNGVAEALTGWTQEEAVGRILPQVFRIVNEESSLPCEDPVAKVLASGVIVGLANGTVLIARDGTKRVIADSGAPIRDREGHILGVVLVFRDITQKRKMEEDLLRTSKLEAVGLLAGGIAHDFNNLLTAILGNLSLAMVSLDPRDPLHKRLGDAEQASLRARDLSQQLLTFSKGGTPLKKTTSIEALLKETTEFALRGSNVGAAFSFAEDLRPVDIDEGQISQVIHNLVLNAQQAMPEGGTLRVSAENWRGEIKTEKGFLLPPGDYVRVSVQDSGVGIPREHLQKIFDPYFTTKQKGSGLGLATAYAIIKKHGGHIMVESSLGAGSTFCFYLPASPRKVKEETPEKELPRGRGRILIMDDETAVREVAGEILATLGYEIEYARDGAEAIARYKEASASGRPFDALIMDLTIPSGMGGAEAIRKLIEIDPGVKAIVSSGYSDDPIMAEYARYGFRGAISKLYKTEDLGKIVHEVITAPPAPPTP